MKKWLHITMAAVLSMLMFSVVPVQAEDTGQSGKEKVQLTEQQKQELSKLQNDVLKKKKALIEKYVAYGVIPKEKGEKIISHMEKHTKMMKENGFQPYHDWGKSKKWHNKKDKR